MREAAVAALVALLDASANIKTVARETSPDLLSAQAFPVVIVSDNGNEQIDPKTAGYADVRFTIDLEMLVQASGGQSTALNALDDVVKGIVGANPTLSGTVAHARIMPQTGGDTKGDDNIASRTRSIQIFYEATYAGGL